MIYATIVIFNNVRLLIYGTCIVWVVRLSILLENHLLLILIVILLRLLSILVVEIVIILGVLRAKMQSSGLLCEKYRFLVVYLILMTSCICS